MRIVEKNDITIIGGGFAGVCAAITAARMGKKVALINNRPVLGGNSSSEVRVWTRGATGGKNFYAEEMGIVGEIKLENLYKNKEGNPIFWDEILLDFVLREKNLSLFLNTNIDGIEMTDDEKIHSVMGTQLGTEKRFRFESSYFIDSSGDGTVGHLSGADYTRGREAKDQFGEVWGQDQKDDYSLSSTIMFKSKELDHKVDYIPPSFAYSKEKIEELVSHGGRVVNQKRNYLDYWWIEVGGVNDTIADNEEVVFELKKLLYGVWDYIKNSGKFEAENMTLEWMGKVPGKRESRRFLGDYVLTEKDVIETKYHNDGVCYGGWYVDFHPPEGVYSDEEFCNQIAVSAFDIPMRCLYSRNIKNLMFSGRIISTTHAAFASTRIQNTCGLTGQASGTIASMSLDSGIFPQDYSEEQIQEVRQTLLKNDMYVLGCENKDISDLAKMAKLTSSGNAQPGNSRVGEFLSLDKDIFMLMPKVEDMNDIILKIKALDKTELTFEFYSCEFPQGFRIGEKACDVSLNVEAGDQDVKVPLSSLADNQSYYMVIKTNNMIRIATSDDETLGYFAGFYEDVIEIKPFKRFDLWFNLDGLTDLYSVSNLTNGFNRPYGLPNAWVSDLCSESKPWIQLDFDEVQSVSEVNLYLNPDLSQELVSVKQEDLSPHHGFTPRSAMPLMLLSDMAIYVNVEGRWQLFEEIKGNTKRHIQVIKEPIECNAIRVEFIDSYGKDMAEVFEIRVY